MSCVSKLFYIMTRQNMFPIIVNSSPYVLLQCTAVSIWFCLKVKENMALQQQASKWLQVKVLPNKPHPGFQLFFPPGCHRWRPCWRRVKDKSTWYLVTTLSLVNFCTFLPNIITLMKWHEHLGGKTKSLRIISVRCIRRRFEIVSQKFSFLICTTSWQAWIKW